VISHEPSKSSPRVISAALYSYHTKEHQITMPAPPTFGSVGDIISVCLIVKDLVSALDQARGASAEYQAVIRDLWSLERALLEVEILARTYDRTPELNALTATARREVDQCRECIVSFFDKIKKHGKIFDAGDSGNRWKSVASSIKWQLFDKDDLSKFRTLVNGHAPVINMILITSMM
jgi:hypothetical protein